MQHLLCGYTLSLTRFSQLILYGQSKLLLNIKFTNHFLFFRRDLFELLFFLLGVAVEADV